MTKPTVSKHWRKTSWSSRSGLNPTRTTPPCYNNTTLSNRLYAQHKGPNVTNPICWTCKNCSDKCAADCEHCHTIQHRAVLIIFPLNLQTITITRMLSRRGRGRSVLGRTNKDGNLMQQWSLWQQDRMQLTLRVKYDEERKNFWRLNFNNLQLV